MQIDWVTVAAQIVNFLILVWLLKHFLYGPVVRAMDRREQHIAERLEQAEAKARQAQEKADSYDRKARDLEGKRDELLRQAREEAESYRGQLRREIRDEMDTERERMRRQVGRERRDFLRDLRRRIAEQFEALARRALGDLSDRELEAQIASTFTARVKDMDADLRGRIATAAIQQRKDLIVCSSWELPADLRRRLTRTLHEAFGESLDVTYRQDTDLTCGIELRAAGHSVLWSLEAYLDTFEARLSEKLDEMAADTRSEAA